MAIPFWAGHYIGLPYQQRGRDVKGLDCWGLVRLVLAEQLNIHVPSYVQYYQSSEDEKQIGPLVRREILQWRQVPKDEAQLGDIVILRMRGAPMHIGLVLDERYMLHIERGINSVIEPYQNMKWINRTVGFFRYQSKGG